MTTAPEDDGNGRVRFKYDSEDPSPVSLPGTADATPAVIRPGDVVEVNAYAADLMRDDEKTWTETDEPVTVPPTRAEQRAQEAADAEGGGAPKRTRKRAETPPPGDQGGTGNDEGTNGGDPA